MDQKVDFKLIKKLREELNDLLTQQPKMKVYQQRVEEELRKAGTNPHNRMAVIQNLLVEQKLKLKKAMTELRDDLKKAIVETRNKKDILQ